MSSGDEDNVAASTNAIIKKWNPEMDVHPAPTFVSIERYPEKPLEGGQRKSEWCLQGG